MIQQPKILDSKPLPVHHISQTIVQSTDFNMGGFNHCLLANLRGLMYGWKYSALIGHKRVFFCAQHDFLGYGLL